MPADVAIPLALWLLPRDDDATWLADRIRLLASRHGGPLFEPHVTLHVGRCTPETDVAAVLRTRARRESPLTLVASRTAGSAARFKALFVEFDGAQPDAGPLVALRRHLVNDLLSAAAAADPGTSMTGASPPSDQAHQALEQTLASYELLPHLSLLYGDIHQTLRDELRAQNDMRGRSINFDRIAAVRPAAGHADLSQVDHWDVFGCSRLSS